MEKKEQLYSFILGIFKILNWKDVLAVVAIIISSSFFVANYAAGNFLDTSYQDWVYHAFRLQTVQTHGMTSWDPIWSNGLNLWRSYQYLIYYVLLGLNRVFQLSIPQLMIASTIAVFILTRIGIYLLLRDLKIRPLLSLIGVISTFYIIQQWGSMKDFSIFIASIVTPLFMYVWIKSTNNKKWLPVTTSLAAAGWFLHPIVGLIFSGLWGLLLLFIMKKLKISELLTHVIFFGLIFGGFIIPYFIYGYGFTNPYISTPEFMRISLLKEGSFGLSRYIFGILSFSWIIIILLLNKISRWVKILILFTTVYIGFLLMSINNFLPDFIMKLQFSRGMFIIGYLICIIFAYVLEQLMAKKTSKLYLSILAISAAGILIESTMWAAEISAPTTTTLSDPVSSFAATLPASPTGSIYYIEPAFPSFSAFDKLTYPNSYNTHMEPQPNGFRYHLLMAHDIAFTSIPESKLQLIDAYTHSLGVEFLVLPNQSPILENLADPKRSNPYSRIMDITTDIEVFTVIKSPFKISKSYLIKNELSDQLRSDQPLADPTLKASSYYERDKAIVQLSQTLDNSETQIATAEYKDKTTLHVTLPEIDTANYKLLITQSFDPYWTILDTPGASISQTKTNFILISLPPNTREITLKHTWPRWFWPLQILSLASFVIFIASALMSSIIHKVRSRK